MGLIDPDDFIYYELAFLDAARDGDIAAAERILDEERININYKEDDTKGNALHEASHNRQLNMVNFLVMKGIKLDEQDHMGYSGIDFAAFNGDAPMVKSLLDAGATQFVVDHNGYTPFINAGGQGSKPVEAEKVRGLLKRYKNLPQWDELSPLGKEQLFTPDENGHPLLETPSTWHHFGAVAESLSSRGEILGLADLQRTNEEGISWLQRGVECRAASDVIKHLNAQHEHVRAAELLTRDRTASPVLTALAETHQLGALFTQENWQGASAEEVTAVYRAVPAELQGQVKNLHGLVSRLTQQENRRGQGR